MKRISVLKAILARYATFLRWLTIDSIFRFRWRGVVVLGTGLLAMAMELNAVALALYYARLLEAGGEWSFMQWTVPVRDSGGLLIAFASLVFVGFLGSALLGYYSRCGLLKLRRDYEVLCSKRVFRVVERVDLGRPPEGDDVLTDGAILQIARRDARYCGRALVALLSSVVPGVTLVVATVVLVSINVLLTAGLAVLVALSSFFFYRVSVRGARNSKLMETKVREAAPEYKHVLRRGTGMAAPYPDDDRWLDEELFGRGHVKTYLDAYSGRLRMSENSQLIGNIVFAIALFGLLVGLGSKSIVSGAGWGELLVYLVAMRYALVNFKQITTKFTNINRFYPQISRYRRFVSAPAAADAADRKVADVVRVGDDPLEESLAEIKVEPGHPLALVTPIDLRRGAVSYTFRSMLALDGRSSRPWFATPEYGWLNGRTVVDCLGFPEGYDGSKLRAALGPLADTVLQGLPDGLTTPIEIADWQQVAAPVRFLLAVARGLAEKTDWILLDERGLRALDEDAARGVVGLLEQCRVAIVFAASAESVGRFGEDAVAVMLDGDVLGVGPVSWFTPRREQIETLLGTSAIEAGTEIEEEEDDEM